MSAINLPALPKPASSVIPPLETGDRLTADEFDRRYRAMPPNVRAELIEGVVYLMPSPVSSERHGDPHFDLQGWLSTYQRKTPGTRGSDNATVKLDDVNVPQPDVLLRIRPECGGQAKIVEGYVVGPPELAIEIASSSVSYDLHVKKETYRRFGVQEYLVWRVLDGEIDWFVRRGPVFEPLAPGPDGILRSEVFPGLWLDPRALMEENGNRLDAVLAEGLASPAHAAFVQRLQHIRTQNSASGP